MARKIPPEAFDAYFGMGRDRSYEAVAGRYGVTKRAVTKLAAKEDWQNRMLALEAKAREASDKKKVETLEAMRERHLKAMRAIQVKALETLKRMDIGSAMDAVRALALSVREERVILGEPSERTAISVEDTIKREYERWMVSEAPAIDGVAEVSGEANGDGD